MSLIDNLYPSIDTSVFRHVDSEDFQEWGAHEMFAETRRKVRSLYRLASVQTADC